MGSDGEQGVDGGGGEPWLLLKGDGYERSRGGEGARARGECCEIRKLGLGIVLEVRAFTSFKLHSHLD